MTLKTGDALPIWRFEVRPEAMQVLARVLDDPNPIHLDPQAVKAMGLGDRVINQGPANLAYAVNMLLAACQGAKLVSLDSRFLGNVRGGDIVEAGGTVTACNGTSVSCEYWVKIEDGQTAVAGSATLELPAPR